MLWFLRSCLPEKARIFWGGSPPSFGPFWLWPRWGSGWPAQFLQQFPRLSLSFIFCIFLLQSFFIFRVEGGGSFPCRSEFHSLSFPGAIRGSSLVLLATKANLFWEGGGQVPRSLWPFLWFLRTFMENYLAIVAPKVILLRNTTTAPHAKQAVQNLPATHDISQPALEFSALSSGWPDAWNVLGQCFL